MKNIPKLLSLALVSVLISASASAQQSTDPNAMNIINAWNYYYQSTLAGGEYIDGSNVTGLPYHLKTQEYKYAHICADASFNFDYTNLSVGSVAAEAVRGIGGFMVGLHVKNDDLLCSKTSASLPIFDTNTLRLGMHACPVGRAMVGIHERLNILLCSTPSDGRTLLTGQERAAYWGDRRGMHACPIGWVMTGVNVNANQFLCTPTSGPGSSPPNDGSGGGTGGGSGGGSVGGGATNLV